MDRSPCAPEPHPDRMTPLGGHPLVVGAVPGHPESLTPTAVSLSRALGPVPLCFAATALLSRRRHRPVRVVPSSVADRVVTTPWA